MSQEINGQLIPVGGGDNIPLVREKLVIGRRESCDICWPFANVSSKHCELSFRDGYWYIKDLNSTNGIKVNDNRVQNKLLHPGDVISIAKRRYKIEYTLAAERRAAEMEDEEEDDILSRPLLERAGLEKPKDRPKWGPDDSDDASDILLADE